MPKAPPQTVTIRFRKDDTEHSAEFHQQAKEAGMKPGEYARKLIFDALYDTGGQDLATLQAEVRILQKALRDLRNDLATSVHCLLVNAGKLTAEQAKDWVYDTLRKH